MRRALVVFSVIAGSLLGLGRCTVDAAVAAAPVRATIHLHLRSGGFLVTVHSGSEGKQLDLDVVRHGELTIYSVKPRQEGDSVEANFGRLGSLDLSFQGEPRQRCHRLTETKGTFEGNFDFTGENGYIHFDVHRVQGSVVTTRGGCPNHPVATPRKPEGRAEREEAERKNEELDREAAESEAIEEPSATLTAITPGPLPREIVRVSAQRLPHGFEGVAAAFRLEREGPVSIARGAEIRIGGAGFRWNLAEGTAALHPAAPFTGSATFRRNPGSKPSWTGNLRVPTLGGRPLELTGSQFNARLVEGLSF